jgi:hypothetical protein
VQSRGSWYGLDSWYPHPRVERQAESREHQHPDGKDKAACEEGPKMPGIMMAKTATPQINGTNRRQPVHSPALATATPARTRPIPMRMEATPNDVSSTLVPGPGTTM